VCLYIFRLLVRTISHDQHSRHPPS
jgi:hypothetical protein